MAYPILGTSGGTIPKEMVRGELSRIRRQSRTPYRLFSDKTCGGTTDLLAAIAYVKLIADKRSEKNDGSVKGTLFLAHDAP